MMQTYANYTFYKFIIRWTPWMWKHISSLKTHTSCSRKHFTHLHSPPLEPVLPSSPGSLCRWPTVSRSRVELNCEIDAVYYRHIRHIVNITFIHLLHLRPYMEICHLPKSLLQSSERVWELCGSGHHAPCSASIITKKGRTCLSCLLL